MKKEETYKVVAEIPVSTNRRNNTFDSKRFKAALKDLIFNLGLAVTTGTKQRKNGTIELTDPATGYRYTLHRNGYLRKRYAKRWYGNDQYQLNPRMKVLYEYRNGSYMTSEVRKMLGEQEMLQTLGRVIPNTRKLKNKPFIK
jgi:hypothetical protein